MMKTRTGKKKENTQSAPKPMPRKEKWIAWCFYLFVCTPVLLGLPVATEQGGWLALTIPLVFFLIFLMAKWRGWEMKTGRSSRGMDDFFEEQQLEFFARRSREYMSSSDSTNHHLHR